MHVSLIVAQDALQLLADISANEPSLGRRNFHLARAVELALAHVRGLR